MNSIKLAYRNIVKNGSYTVINVLGLTLAFTLCLLVFSVLSEEKSYDTSWSKANRIYRINTVELDKGIEGEINQVYANLGLELKNQFPEVEAAAAMFSREIFLNLGTDQTVEVRSIFMQKDAFNILDFKIIEGNPNILVAGKTNIMINREFRDKYFKGENVIGKLIKSSDPLLEESENVGYVIVAVFDEIPYNSTFRTPVITFSEVLNNKLSKNGDGYYQEQYIALKPNTDIAAFSQKANKWYKDFLSDSAVKNFSFRFQPLKEIYMNPVSHSDIYGNEKTTFIFQIIALLVLVISFINFINLYAVRTIKRIKSLNLHKILGASRYSLIKSLLLETIIIFLIAALISIFFYLLALPPLESFLNFKLYFTREIVGSILIYFILTVLLSGLIIGFYPAWIVSNIKSSEALKNKLSKVSNVEVWMKKSLIIFQFSVSLIVIVGLITVKSQLNLIQNTPKGLNTENLLNIKQLYLSNKSSTIKNELLRIPGVEKVSISAWRPNIGSGYLARTVDDKKNVGEKIRVSFIGGDADFTPLLDIKLIAGRNLTEKDYIGHPKPNPKFEGDEFLNALITESTAKRLGLSDLGIPIQGLDIIPVGIVADFHSESFHKPLSPTVILAKDFQEYGNILIKIKDGQENVVGKRITQTMYKHFPDKYFNFEWVDDLIANNYQKELKQAQIFTLSAFLALFISALGVTGLILQSVEQRTKEIGIRKVLGASIASISNLFGKEYVLMIIIAIVIASPIAWILANKWLEDFAFKTEVKLWFFGSAGFIVLIVTLITVNIQTIKAALVNPVDSLRDE
ncbi:ABC transporter permease [Sphingobacterium endophyticum]|uniref:ABC transporter permease n=1 Tax=Sphingobacterium endophyticum TaxID=2546448 RepID=UPI0012E11F11|nr:ABC transporter permease [Sphingobacterium endophyticum]